MSIFQEMADKWPSSIVARTEIKDFTGGAISEKYLANLDSLGKGPANRFRLGRKVVYRTSDVVDWLQSRSESIPQTDMKGAGH
ncbi:MAG TPA: hypothetical protein PLX58_04425 [Smithellaceae bacterium]|nr:hypothetical protein [Smithellaceae bacterium]HQF84197.1 hypothetical protein [Smithellaceae bacterium]HQG79481.1 hypothetical protein [Smithellaceae bacterium]